MTGGLTSNEVLDKLDRRMTYRQLDHWIRTGKIRPSIETRTGSGWQRRWTEDDVVMLALILDEYEAHRRWIERFDAGELWLAKATT